MRALLLGHFSTVGDIESLEWVQHLLTAEGIAFDTAPYVDKYVAALPGALPIGEVEPGRYSHLVVICGPIWPELLRKRGVDLRRFAHCVRIGVNLTMVEPLEQWDPFHVLLERDSDRASRPDLTFLSDTGRVPVVGVCTIARQREYGERQRHGEALQLIDELVRRRGLAPLAIDTRWPAGRNDGGLGTPEQVLSVISRVDTLLTNRLHGMVFALKAGVPVLAIDPVAGGDKVTAQAEVLDWPAVTTVEHATPERVDSLLDWCLSDEGREKARAVAAGARTQLQSIGDDLRAALRIPFEPRPLPVGRTRGWAKRLLGRSA